MAGLLSQNKAEVILAPLENTKCRLYVKEYARSRSKIQFVELKADMVRNRRIFSLIANDPEQGCVFFWDGVSRDVADDIKSAKECGIPCRGRSLLNDSSLFHPSASGGR